MKINLLELAKQADNLYRDVECSFGTIRVYHVPDSAVISVTLDKPYPEQPMVRMKIAGGRTQERLSKPGDKEYQEWQKEVVDYNQDLMIARGARRIVLALPDIDYPDVSKPPTKMAERVYNGNWPDNEEVRKKIWLDYTIHTSDMDKIYNAIGDLAKETAVTEDMVDAVKKNSE